MDFSRQKKKIQTRRWPEEWMQRLRDEDNNKNPVVMLTLSTISNKNEEKHLI